MQLSFHTKLRPALPPPPPPITGDAAAGASFAGMMLEQQPPAPASDGGRQPMAGNGKDLPRAADPLPAASPTAAVPRPTFLNLPAPIALPVRGGDPAPVPVAENGPEPLAAAPLPVVPPLAALGPEETPAPGGDPKPEAAPVMLARPLAPPTPKPVRSEPRTAKPQREAAAALPQTADALVEAEESEGAADEMQGRLVGIEATIAAAVADASGSSDAARPAAPLGQAVAAGATPPGNAVPTVDLAASPIIGEPMRATAAPAPAIVVADQASGTTAAVTIRFGASGMVANAATATPSRPVWADAAPVSVAPTMASLAALVVGDAAEDEIDMPAGEAVPGPAAPTDRITVAAEAISAPGRSPETPARDHGAALQRDAAWAERMMGRIEEAREAADATDRRIRVTPDALGAVDLRVRREGDAVRIQLSADDPATRAMLAEAAPRIAELSGRSLHPGGGPAGDPGAGHRPPTPPSAPAAASAARANPAETDILTDNRLA